MSYVTTWLFQSDTCFHALLFFYLLFLILFSTFSSLPLKGYGKTNLSLYGRAGNLESYFTLNFIYYTFFWPFMLVFLPLSSIMLAWKRVDLVTLSSQLFKSWENLIPGVVCAFLLSSNPFSYKLCCLGKNRN